jgi:hypothetical protein
VRTCFTPGAPDGLDSALRPSYREGMSTQPVPVDVAEYLAALEGERGDAARAVFETVHNAMPEGYELGSFRGSPLWTIPLSTHPDTYNGEPLSYVALMAQKNYNSLYLMWLYSDPDEYAEFVKAWADSGLKLNMGKSCLRFKTLNDVNLDIIASTVAKTSVDRFLADYERLRNRG